MAIVALAAVFLPAHTASRAGNNVDPSIGLSFSGAGVLTQHSSLNQAAGSTTFQAPVTEGSTFSSAGLLEGASPRDAGVTANLLAQLNPTPTPAAGTSSSPAEEASATPEGEPEVKAADGQTVPTSLCDTTIAPTYCVYTIQPGDTLSTVADRFGLTSSDNVANYELLLHSNKPDIVSVDDPLRPDAKIRIPLHNGAIHTVLRAETLFEIAEQYGVTMDAIMAVASNGIANPDAISIGTEILIPNPQQFAPIFIPEETPAVAEADTEAEPTAETTETATTSESEASPEPTTSDSSSESAASAPTEPAMTGSGPSSSAGMIWPVHGPLSNYMSARHPLGIDIDLFGSSGAPISAAMGGVVTFAGGNACCSYGLYVVIDHGNGFQTLYAHLSSLGVSPGQVVAQGQYVGASGVTGYSTGEHLHFEVTLNGARVNPMNYLP